MIPRALLPSQRQTSPFPPLSLLYSPTSRPAGVRFDRPTEAPPPPPFFLPPLTPPQTPRGWEGPATRAAPEPVGVPQTLRHRPRQNAHILSAAPSPAQMLQTPLTCIDAMMAPSPQGRRGQRRRGRSRRARVTPRGPSTPGARGGASDGKGASGRVGRAGAL